MRMMKIFFQVMIFKAPMRMMNNFPQVGILITKDDYANVVHFFLSGEFKGNSVDDDYFPPSGDFQGTDEDDVYFSPIEDFQGTNEDDE
jgi:hypothetical protein